MNNTFINAAMAALTIAIAGAAEADLYYTDFNELEPGISLTDQIDGVTVGFLDGVQGEGPKTIAISGRSDGCRSTMTACATRPTGCASKT